MLLASSVAAAVLAAPATIVPKPVSLETRPGRFVFDSRTVIAAPASLRAAASLQAMMRRAAGLALPIVAGGPGPDRVAFVKVEPGKVAREGYVLDISRDRVTVRYSEDPGAFYAVQTMRQLLPPEVESAGQKGVVWAMPAVKVEDKPRFGWRGLHLDVSRHFFDVAFIKRYIDWIAMMKMNVFHWHLVDDGGWRMEVKRYPKLTEVGAWRIDTGGKWPGGDWNYANLRFCLTPEDGPRYGGFYTQDEIREIVRYAADRHVAVVPEIELPGHSLAAVVAYPGLGCEGQPPAPRGTAAGNAFCAGNPESFRFLEGVLAETLELFPSKYIHIGGDELDKRIWNQCPRCQARRKELGLKDMDGLQSHFVRHFDAWLTSRGRRLVGWDEILEGGLAQGATVMSWRGVAGGIEAVKQGKDAVMSPTSHCYFDYSYQSTPTQHVYGWEPVPPGLTAEQSARILGGQANVWTEFIATVDRCEEMVFPRAWATAEVLWSPAAGRSWDEFEPRLLAQLPRLERLGVDYHVGSPSVAYDAIVLEPGKQASVAARPVQGLRYTQDGSAPTATSPLYRGPIPVGKAKTLKFAVVRPSGAAGDVATVQVAMAPAMPAVVRQPGLGERWFEGKFESMPDTSKLTPFATGRVADPNDFALRRDDAFLVELSGVIKIETAGVHTFWLTSDDGSVLEIAGARVVDNDGPHAMLERRGRVLLPKGDFPFRILWSEIGGAEGLKVEHMPPGGKRGPLAPRLLTH